jgi:segregation and condensation protein A
MTRSPFVLSLESFHGPIEELLEQIESQALPVASVSLARVTDDFVQYVEALTRTLEGTALTAADRLEAMRLIADFVSIASKLLLIKSKTLIPDLTLPEEEERELKDLEARLAWFQAFKPAMRHLASGWKRATRSYARSYLMHVRSLLLLSGNTTRFYPGPTLSPATLQASLARLLTLAPPPPLPAAVLKQKMVSLESVITSIKDRLLVLKEGSLRALAGGGRAELVVAFLAILHLAREQVIALEQVEGENDILVRHQTS